MIKENENMQPNQFLPNLIPLIKIQDHIQNTAPSPPTGISLPDLLHLVLASEMLLMATTYHAIPAPAPTRGSTPILRANSQECEVSSGLALVGIEGRFGQSTEPLPIQRWTQKFWFVDIGGMGIQRYIQRLIFSAVEEYWLLLLIGCPERWPGEEPRSCLKPRQD